MARMLTSDYKLEFTKSKAERKLFKKLESSCPHNWIILHSYPIPHLFDKETYKKKMESEIDFLVLVPNLGIAAFEVKGGRITTDSDYKWYSNNEEIKDPFRQIARNIYNLRDNYEKQYDKKSFPIFNYGVIFPDYSFPLDNECSYERWRILDKRSMQDIVSSIISFLKTSRKYLNEEDLKRRTLREDELDDFANKLIPKPNKEIIPYTDWKKLIDESQKEFEEEQLQVLCNTTYAHNRCLIEGYTGTGKTLIAIKTAEFSLKKRERIAFFCYNSILANWLKKQLPPIPNGSFVGVFHDFLIEKIDIAVPQDEMPNSIKNYINKKKNILQGKMVDFPDDVIDNDDFWENIVPETALIAFKNIPVEYDKIIIDEAQDIFVEKYFYVLNEILKGGIPKGKWCFFADREQHIEKSQNMMSYDYAISSFLGVPWDDYSRPPPLTKNWRNSGNIDKVVSRLTNWSNYHNISDKIEEGQKVKYYQWSTPHIEQKEKIEECLTNLIKNENIKCHEITLLSTFDPHRYKNPTWYEKSVLSQIKEHRLIKYKEDVKENGITFSTIASFKGMENDTIILVDVDSYKDKNLIYVGMSRARVRLIVFESEQAKEERKKLWG